MRRAEAREVRGRRAEWWVRWVDCIAIDFGDGMRWGGGAVDWDFGCVLVFVYGAKDFRVEGVSVGFWDPDQKEREYVLCR